MKIGVNEPCPCGSGKKYKKCCKEKDEGQESRDALKKEVNAVVGQLFDKFQELAHTNWKGTFMEEPVRKNMESLYLQCRYINEKMDNSILLGISADVKKHEIIERRAKTIKKLIWDKPNEEVRGEKIFLVWGKYKTELEPNEFVDLIISTFASIFEYYVDLLKNNVFDCVKLAKDLGLSHLLQKIRDINSIGELYDKLSEEAQKEYPNQNVNSLFNKRAYQIRCADSHNDYSFRKENDGSFSIVLENGKDSIKFEELLRLSNDIFSELNILTLIPHYFKKRTLPIM